MEILESQDPDKKKLIETSERHKRALEKDVSEMTDKTEKMVKNALIIGGALALSYLVVSQLSKTKTKKKKHKKYRKVTAIAQPVSTVAADEEEEYEEPGLIAGIGQKIASHATAVLVDLAREKLMEYLDSRKKNEAS